jgi:hypothetical protein
MEMNVSETGSDSIFDFVDDGRLRTLLENYHAEAGRALGASAYLGTITACGGVLEGLLAWRLLHIQSEARNAKRAQKAKDGTVPPLPKWNLAALIAVARDLNVIGSTAESACWSVKQFRDFVHPYNCLEMPSSQPNEHLAKGALAAVGEVVRSVSGRMHR